MNTQLLCTFVKTTNIIKWLKEIYDYYDFMNGKVYILDIGSKQEVVCSYNIIATRGQHIEHYPNTISVHRRKQTNTIYTINALNEIVKNVNNGLLDSSVEINWDNYKNKLLVTNEYGLKQFDTSIKEVIHV